MSIFNLEPLESRDEIKKKLCEYFCSSELVFLCDCGYGHGITMKDVTQIYLNNFGIPILANNLDKLSIYQLIELFLNIEANWNYLIEECPKEFNHEYSSNSEEWRVLKKIDLYLKNIVTTFLNKSNIKILKKNNKFVLNLNDVILIDNIKNADLRTLIVDYLKIKESDKSPENKQKKLTILSALKNNMDSYFKNDDNSSSNDSYITVKKGDLKLNWQALGSHKGSKSNNEKIEEIKKNFDNSPVEEQHKKLNNLIDAIIYIIFVNKY